MSLGWSLRGQFGHLHGAAIPGAFAAAAVALTHCDRRWSEAFGWSVMFSVAGFAVGGHLSYGSTIERLLEATSLSAMIPGLLRLSCLGAAWGGLGLTFLGYAISERPFRLPELGLFGFVALCWILLLGVMNQESLDLVLFWLGLVCLHGYNGLVSRSRIVRIFGLAGVVGFGLGFPVATLLLSAGHHGRFGDGWPWWTLRDQIIGGCGGLALAWVRLAVDRRGLFPARTFRSTFSQVAGFGCFLIGVPAVNMIDVLTSWSVERPILPSGRAMAAIFVAGAGMLPAMLLSLRFWKVSVSTVEVSRRSREVVRMATLIAIWWLSALAIAKETVPLGLGRWEPAFTFFILFSLAITVLLEAERKRQRFGASYYREGNSEV